MEKRYAVEITKDYHGHGPNDCWIIYDGNSKEEALKVYEANKKNPQWPLPGEGIGYSVACDYIELIRVVNSCWYRIDSTQRYANLRTEEELDKIQMEVK